MRRAVLRSILGPRLIFSTYDKTTGTSTWTRVDGGASTDNVWQ